MMKGMGSRALSGGLRGALYGIAGGFIMGTIGNVFGESMSTKRVITWENTRGETKRFTDLETLEAFDIYRDLTTLHDSSICDKEAFNDACRHIQSVVYLYKRFLDTKEAGMMDHRKITNYSIMATKSMNALLISCRADKYPESDKVEESMMHIHLAFDEIIHAVRKSSMDVLPELMDSS